MRTAGIVLCGGRSSRMGVPKAWLPFGDEFMLARVVRVVQAAVGPVVVVAAPGQELPPLPPGTVTVRDEEEGQGPLAGFAAGLAALEGAADAVYLSSCDVPFLRAEFVWRMVASLGRAAAEEPNPPTPFPKREGGARKESAVWSPSPRSGPREAPLTGPESMEGGVGEGALASALPLGRAAGGGGLPSTILACIPRVNDRLHPLAAAYRVGVLPTVRAMLAARQLRMTDLFDRVHTRVIGPDELTGADPELVSLRNVNTPEEYEAARKSLS